MDLASKNGHKWQGAIDRTALTILCITSFLFSGCAMGRFNYYPPERKEYDNIIVASKPFEDLWKDAIKDLGSSSFIVGNINKEAGFINVSYHSSINSEKYVDCGRVRSYIKSLMPGKKRSYDFPLSKNQFRIEVPAGDGISTVAIDVKQALEGKINVFLSAINEKETMVKVNIRYVLSQFWENGEWKETVTFTFNSLARDIQATTAGDTRITTTCFPTGELEREVLERISR